MNFFLDIPNLFSQLLLFTAQLTHIVVERVVLGLSLLEAFYNLLNGTIHANGFLDSGKSLFVLLNTLH